MLKFRLPYVPPVGFTEYLDGDLFLPVWDGRTTSESRLVVTDPVCLLQFCDVSFLFKC